MAIFLLSRLPVMFVAGLIWAWAYECLSQLLPVGIVLMGADPLWGCAASRCLSRISPLGGLPALLGLRGQVGDPSPRSVPRVLGYYGSRVALVVHGPAPGGGSPGI